MAARAMRRPLAFEAWIRERGRIDTVFMNMTIHRRHASLFFLFACLLGTAAAQPSGANETEALPKLGGYASTKDGQRFNLRIVDNRFRMYFLGEEDRPIEPPIRIANVRYLEWGDPTEDEFVRLESNGEFLTSPRYIPPPFQYRCYVTFSLTGKEADNETFNFWVRQ